MNIYTPYANVDFILDLLREYKDQLYGLRLTFDEIDNPEKLRSEFEDVVLNLEQSKGTHGKIMSIFNDNDYSFFAGTSNISRSGLGKGYTKPESNLAFDGNFEAFNEFALFSMNPSLYASNKFENKLKMYEAIYNKSKSRRDLIKYFRKVEDITKKYEKIIDKIIKAEENNDYAQLIRTLKEIYNEDKKEDEINKMHMSSFGVKFHEELEKRAKKII